MYQRILVPVDGSPTSERGLEEAIRLAKDQGAMLKLIHVVEEYVLVQGAGVYGEGTFTGDLLEMLFAEGRRIVAEAAALAGKQGVKTVSQILESFSNRCADKIVEVAKEWPADLIVMGTHGRRGVSRFVLGSDAEIVVRTSPVPVLLVRSTEPDATAAASKAA